MGGGTVRRTSARGRDVPAELRASARRALKVSAIAADALRPERRGVVVLCYHRVGGRSGLAVDLDPARFDDQMATLAGSGAVATLDDALEALAGDPPAGPDPVVVTFDDGTADFVDVALPLLVRHRVPVVLYLATAFVDERERFPHDGVPVSWSALRDALGTGLVTIGSHTHRHVLLDRCDAATAADELDRSVDLVGERLGVRAEHFAYPKALPARGDVEAEVRQRFRSAAVAGTRANPYGRTDAHRLARSPIQVGDGVRYFRRKVAGGMALEDTARRVANRLRYAGATT